MLPGSEPGEEVLTLGHTSEQGAHDNATGVSAMVEAVATLKRLIDTGKLPRPRRTIRVLLMPELYGWLSYISANPARMKSTVAAITVDTPAAPYGLAGTEYTLYMNPHVAKSWTDALIARVTEACLPAGRPWHISEHMTGTDAYLGEPSIGVPDVWLYSGTGVTTHHNSADKPDTVDERSMRDLVRSSRHICMSTLLRQSATFRGSRLSQWIVRTPISNRLLRRQSRPSLRAIRLPAPSGSIVSGTSRIAARKPCSAFCAWRLPRDRTPLVTS